MTRSIDRDHDALARSMAEEFAACRGIMPLDLDAFWRDNGVALSDPFAADCPMVPWGRPGLGDAVFDELGIDEDFHGYETDPAFRAAINRRYNDRAEAIIGIRPFSVQTPPDPARQYPGPAALHDLFEARNQWHAGSWWLMPSAGSPDELRALLDRVEARISDPRRLREAVLPPGWDEARDRLLPEGITPPLYRHQRGPVTFATSVFGAENLLFLILDDPDLADCLRDTILRAMLVLAALLDGEAGYTHRPDGTHDAPRGFSFADDNCALLNEDMYRRFAQPILAAVFDRYCPDPGDRRFQHSDSDMGHLLAPLAETGLNRVNFGPKLTVAQIRRAMPNAVIEGQLPPFTLASNDPVSIVRTVLRDIEHARRGDPPRGLVCGTAGSVLPGSKLTSIRLILATLDRHGRY